MIATCRRQRSFADGFIFDEVKDLWEPWMRHADKALEDEALLLLIQQELMKRCKKSKTRGRPGTPAEVVLRMMLGGYPLDSGSPYRLWFSSGLPRGRVNNLVIGDGSSGHSLLREAIEELSSAL